MTSELKALTRNTDTLLAENDKLIGANKDLLDRIAILEKALKSEKTLSAAVTRQHDCDALLIKAKEEVIKTQWAEITRLRRYEERVQELKTYLDQLEKLNWPIPCQNLPYDAAQLAELKEDMVKAYGKTAFVGMQIPVYLQPLTDTLKADILAESLILKTTPQLP